MNNQKQPTFILDTHILLWIATYDKKTNANLCSQTLSIVNDTQNKLYFSVASAWEIAIKSAIGRNDFRVNANDIYEKFISRGYIGLPISFDHVIKAGSLPFKSPEKTSTNDKLHNDPFDRLLIAQAGIEGHTLITADSEISKYACLFPSQNNKPGHSSFSKGAIITVKKIP